MRRLVPLILLAFFSACSLGGEGNGCVRVHQGEYEFPLKQVVKDSIKVRVSQQGIDLLASKTKELLQTFFETDENGHAIIPLDELGVGEVTTDLGPFEGSVRNLSMTLDLDGLEVEIVEGAYPPRLRIRVKDADVGLLAGELVGSADAGLFEGDVACVLGNGPSGSVARLSFELVFDLNIAADGTLNLDIKSTDVDLQDIDLSVTTDCSLSECLDGETPPSDAECSECEALCETADLVASLSSQFQGVFNELIDQLISVLGAELSNVLADTLFNGKPFAVEGTMDVGKLFGPLIGYLRGAKPLGVLIRPSGEGFKSVTNPVGVEMTLDAGIAAESVHECAAMDAGNVVFEAGPAPAFPAEAMGADGKKVPYELGFALSEAVVNRSLWSAWQSGALCLDLTSSDLLNVTGGDLDLRASHLELVFPGLGTLVDADARVRVRLHPGFSGNAPPSVLFGNGSKDQPTLTLPLPNLKVAVDVLDQGHGVQLIGFEAGVTLGVSVESLTEGKLGLRVDFVNVDEIKATNNTLFEHVELDLIVELALDLGVTILEKSLDPIEIDAGSLLSGLLGDNLELTILEASDTKDSGWLTILFGLSDQAEAPPVAPMVEATVLGIGVVHLEPKPSVNGRVQYRVDGSGWSRPYDGAVDFRHPRLWLVGEHKIEARQRGEGGRHSEPVNIITITTKPTSSSEQTEAVVELVEVEDEGGCSTTGSSPASWIWIVLLLGLGRIKATRWRFMAVCLLVVGGIAGCADERISVSGTCVENDNCPAGFLCGADKLCVPSSACVADSDCCPGAVCFNGWCRPTSECQDGCDGLDTVCKDGQCIPTECSAETDCSSWSQCIGGRCLRGLACEASCASGDACHLDSGRCLEAPSCPTSCPQGTFRAVAPAVEFDALYCGEQPFPCTFIPYPKVPYPTPGIDGVLNVVDGVFSVVSYDDTYGDLVYSEFLQPDLSRVDWAVDGVPEGPAVYAVDGYREGVIAPGADVGGSPSVLVNEDGEGNAVLDILYQDKDTGSLQYVRFDPGLHQQKSRSSLPVFGLVGEFSCLTKDPSTGRPVGLVYVSRDVENTHSQLVRLEALTEHPKDVDDWVSEVLISRPLPLSKELPCGGECGFTELCALGEEGEACFNALDAYACTEPCPSHTLCAKPPGPGQALCLPRVYFEGQPDRVGAGLFLSCVQRNSTIAAAWYDADLGTLVASVGSPLGSSPTLVDGSVQPDDSPDVGLFSQVSVSEGGQVAIAYQDRFGQDLLWASLGAQEWTVETVVNGVGLDSQPGGWVSMDHRDGLWALAEEDGATGRINLHVRSLDGCWTHEKVWGSGAFTHPDLRFLDTGQVLVSGRSIAFGNDFDAEHELQLKVTDLPTCP